MKRLKTLTCIVMLLAVAGFASASHDEPWWCDIPFFGKFLPGCGVSSGGSDGGGNDEFEGWCELPGNSCWQY